LLKEASLTVRKAVVGVDLRGGSLDNN